MEISGFQEQEETLQPESEVMDPALSPQARGKLLLGNSKRQNVLEKMEKVWNRLEQIGTACCFDKFWCVNDFEPQLHKVGLVILRSFEASPLQDGFQEGTPAEGEKLS